MFGNDIIYILSGIFITIQYTFSAIFFGCIIALLVFFMRVAKIKILNLIAKVYLSVIKGTPLLLQLSIWYFALPQVTGWKISSCIVGIMTFAIYSSAYLAEIIRVEVSNIDQGQVDAGRVIGLTKRDIFFDIILPQIVFNISPKLVNEIISLIKDSAIIGFIGVTDLTRRAQLISETYNSFWPMLIAGVSYYCITVGISAIHSFIMRSRKVKNKEPKIFL